MNAGERAFVAHQQGKDGVCLVNFTVGGGGPRKPGREVDVIVILPRGIFAVEVKTTTAKGELSAPANDLWSVGSIIQPFSTRNQSPAAQVDVSTKILASVLTSKEWPKSYVTPVVAINGPVRVPGDVQWAGTVGVTIIENFDLLTRQAKGRLIHAKHVAPMLEMLGVARRNLPNISTLLGEGFGDGTVSETVPAASSPASGESQRRRRRGFWTSLVLSWVAVAAGAWQASNGWLLRQIAGSEPGSGYFLYSTTPSYQNTDAVGVAWNSPSLVGLVVAIVALTNIGLWLRLRIGPLSRPEPPAFVLSAFALTALSPVLFAGTGWLGLVWAMLVYAFAWPLLSMFIKDLAGPFKRYVAHLRAEYTL